MKKDLTTVIAALLLGTFGCQNDDAKRSPSNPSSSTQSSTSQTTAGSGDSTSGSGSAPSVVTGGSLAGTVNGTNWKFGKGYVFNNAARANSLIIDLYPEGAGEQPCVDSDRQKIKTYIMWITLPSQFASPWQSTHDASDPSPPDNYSVACRDMRMIHDRPMILSPDYTHVVVEKKANEMLSGTLKLDAEVTGKIHVEGTFTAVYCDSAR